MELDKYMKKLLITLTILFPTLAFGAGLTLPQGGLGITTVTAGYSLVGLDTLRVQATSSLQVLPTGNLLLLSTATSTFAGGINLTSGCVSINSSCLTRNLLSTSTPLVSGQVDFSTGVNTIGNDATFLFDSTLKKLSFNYASTTTLTSTGSAYFATTGGNVGIGTTSPASLLSLQGNGASNGMGQLQIVNPSGSANTGFWFDAGTASNAISYMDADTSVKFPAIILRDRTDTVNNLAEIGLGRTGSNFMSAMGRNDFGIANLTSGKSLFFGTNGGAGATAQMVIANTGNVGIGTTSPSQLLTVGNNNQFTVSSAGSVNMAGGIVAQGAIYGLSVNAYNYVDSGYGVDKMTLAGGAGGSATDYVSFSTNSTEKVRILTNGNVGIGTTSPQAKLTITNTGASNQLLFEDSGAASGQHFGSLGFSQGQFNFNILNDAYATTSRMVIDKSGNVGIGTTSPIASLQVNGSMVLGNIATLPNMSGGMTAGNVISNFNNLGGLLLKKTSTGTGDYFEAQDSSANSLFVIKSSGNVGIGTASPGTRLSVVGLAGANDIFDLASSTGTSVLRVDKSGNVGIGTTGPGYALHVVGQIATTQQFKFTDTSGGYHGSFVLNSPSTDDISLFTQSSGSTAKVTFQNSGNVGIGTTSPKSLLTVKGHIGTDGLIPTLTSCGTSPSIVVGSTDTAFEFTEGTISTGCTVTFQTAYARAPFCTVTAQSGLVFSYTISASAITITNIGALSGTTLDGHCWANDL